MAKRYSYTKKIKCLLQRIMNVWILMRIYKCIIRTYTYVLKCAWWKWGKISKYSARMFIFGKILVASFIVNVVSTLTRENCQGKCYLDTNRKDLLIFPKKSLLGLFFVNLGSHELIQYLRWISNLVLQIFLALFNRSPSIHWIVPT